VSGVVILDKPAGTTSAKALLPVKRRFGRGTKVGHAGTLDPFATGVLLVLVGDATRLSDLAMALPKTYRATVRFGVATDTLDPEGEVTGARDPGPEPRDLGLERFVGEISQVPPAFSALKVDGRRAYRLARAGETPALEPRRVRVHRIVLLEMRWPEAEVEIECGQGFYVRALARDLGEALGLPAHLTALRRTHIGPFAAGEADAERVLPARRLVEAAGVPFVAIARDAARRFVAGGPVRGESGPVRGESGPAMAGWGDRVAVETGALFVGLARREGSTLHPNVVFREARRALES